MDIAQREKRTTIGIDMDIKGLKFTHIAIKGGPGSGNWGHIGRPGFVGGSSPGGGFAAIGGMSKLSPKQQAVWDKVVDRINEGDLPHLKDLVKPPKPKKSDAGKVRVVGAEVGEAKRIRGYLEDLPQDHLETIASIQVAQRLGYGGDCNQHGEIRISREERGTHEWDPETQTYHRQIKGASSKEAIIHETGHAVHYYLKKYTGMTIGDVKGSGFDAKLKQASKVHNGLSKGNQVSSYATKNHFELFSESYYAFTHSSKSRKLMRVSKAMEPKLGWSYYDLVKGVFGGREYGK